MSIDVHPSEFAYAFAFARAEEVIGWGSDPFRPTGEVDGAQGDWLTMGEARLTTEGRLVGTPDTGLNFTDEMASAVLALVNPSIVMLAQRKAGDGVQTMTVHIADDVLIGLTRNTEGMFEMERYADLAAAAGACAGFVGADLLPLASEARIESDRETLTGLIRLARDGQTDRVAAELVRLGISGADAASATRALAAPAVAGVVSVLYCQGNAVVDVETFSVMTSDEDQTWIMFPPASLEGPMILERSSAAALTARVAVGIVARISANG
ncbi:MAG: hypothetical protein ACK4GO_13320 [Gemmobacter sp.]